MDWELDDYEWFQAEEYYDWLAEHITDGKDCAFCDVNKATVHTSADDFVCESCRDEFEDALNTGDTE